nr:MAG TPA: hypothetical protein [Caudoviricetes sp.]
MIRSFFSSDGVLFAHFSHHQTLYELNYVIT